MENKKSLVEILQESIDSLTEGEKEAGWESITHEKFYQRWVEKFHKLSTEDRNKWIEAACLKYSSEKYINKEYKLGYEPREDLFDILFRYAELYGYKQECTGDFESGKYVVDGIWEVTLLVGQGAAIDVRKLDKSLMKHKVVVQGNYGSIGDLPNNVIQWIESQGEKYPDILNERHNPVLVEAVEKFGITLWGEKHLRCEKPKPWGLPGGYYRIAEIEGDTYSIREYDGKESVIEPKDIEWVHIVQ